MRVKVEAKNTENLIELIDVLYDMGIHEFALLSPKRFFLVLETDSTKLLRNLENAGFEVTEDLEYQQENGH